MALASKISHAAAAIGIVLLTACGLDSTVSLAGRDGGTQIDVTTTRDGGRADVGVRDAGPQDAIVASDSPPLRDVPAVLDAGTPEDGGLPDDSGFTRDVGIDAGPLPGVTCGSEQCHAAQMCCRVLGTTDCQAASDDCVGNILFCDGPEDCPFLCCGGTRGGGDLRIRTLCQETCGTSQRELCHPGALCSNGNTCTETFTGGGFCAR